MPERQRERPTTPPPLTVLVSGFEPFGSARRNVSGELALALADGARQDAFAFDMPLCIRAQVLPVVYDEAPRRLLALARELRPAALIAFGIHRRETIRLERWAQNRDHAPSPDNAGVIRLGMPIDPRGPDTLPSSLPLAAFARWLARHEFPHEWSDSAGNYLCNHVFYRLAHWREQEPERAPRVAGFVHVPPLEDRTGSISLGDLVRAGAWLVAAAAVAAVRADPPGPPNRADGASPLDRLPPPPVAPAS